MGGDADDNNDDDALMLDFGGCWVWTINVDDVLCRWMMMMRDGRRIMLDESVCEDVWWTMYDSTVDGQCWYTMMCDGVWCTLYDVYCMLCDVR